MVLQPKILHLSLHESIDLLYVVKFFFDHRGVQNRKISNTASKKKELVINFHPFYISTMFVKNWVELLNFYGIVFTISHSMEKMKFFLMQEKFDNAFFIQTCAN